MVHRINGRQTLARRHEATLSTYPSLDAMRRHEARCRSLHPDMFDASDVHDWPVW